MRGAVEPDLCGTTASDMRENSVQAGRLMVERSRGSTMV